MVKYTKAINLYVPIYQRTRAIFGGSGPGETVRRAIGGLVYNQEIFRENREKRERFEQTTREQFLFLSDRSIENRKKGITCIPMPLEEDIYEFIRLTKEKQSLKTFSLTTNCILLWCCEDYCSDNGLNKTILEEKGNTETITSKYWRDLKNNNINGEGQAEKLNQTKETSKGGMGSGV